MRIDINNVKDFRIESGIGYPVITLFFGDFEEVGNDIAIDDAKTTIMVKIDEKQFERAINKHISKYFESIQEFASRKIEGLKPPECEEHNWSYTSGDPMKTCTECGKEEKRKDNE